MRGRALVEAAIEKRGSGERRPMPPEMLAEVIGEIPDSLAAWLAWDTTSPNGDVSLIDEDGLALREAEDLLEELAVSSAAGADIRDEGTGDEDTAGTATTGADWESDTREAMRELALQLPGALLLLRAPCGEDHLLYVGPRGQCPVLVLEHEEIRVGWSSFDVYVAVLDGLLEPDDAERAACARMQRAIFG